MELHLPKSNPPTHVKFSKPSLNITIPEVAKHLQGVHQLSWTRKIYLLYFYIKSFSKFHLINAAHFLALL